MFSYERYCISAKTLSFGRHSFVGESKSGHLWGQERNPFPPPARSTHTRNGASLTGATPIFGDNRFLGWASNLHSSPQSYPPMAPA